MRGGWRYMRRLDEPRARDHARPEEPQRTTSVGLASPPRLLLGSSQQLTVCGSSIKYPPVVTELVCSCLSLGCWAEMAGRRLPRSTPRSSQQQLPSCRIGPQPSQTPLSDCRPTSPFPALLRPSAFAAQELEGVVAGRRVAGRRAGGRGHGQHYYRRWLLSSSGGRPRRPPAAAGSALRHPVNRDFSSIPSPSPCIVMSRCPCALLGVLDHKHTRRRTQARAGGARGSWAASVGGTAGCCSHHLHHGKAAIGGSLLSLDPPLARGGSQADPQQQRGAQAIGTARRCRHAFSHWLLDLISSGGSGRTAAVEVRRRTAPPARRGAAAGAAALCFGLQHITLEHAVKRIGGGSRA